MRDPCPRRRRLLIFVLCGPMLLVCMMSRGCRCRPYEIHITEQKAHEANAKLKPGEHQAEADTYHNWDEPYPQVGIHYLTAEQAQRYGYGPDAKSGNYVGAWFDRGGMKEFHRASPKEFPQSTIRRDTDSRTLQPGARGRTRTGSGHSN